jgi:hypothetical protein
MPARFRERLAVLGVILLLGPGCASRRNADVKEPPGPPDLGVIGRFSPDPWEPILSLAPVEALPSDKVERIRAHEETGRYFRALFSRPEKSPSTAELLDAIWSDLRTLSVARLHALAVPDREDATPGAWRRFTFKAGRIEDRFLFDIRRGKIDPGRETNRRRSGPALFASFGQMAGAFSLRPAPGAAESVYDVRMALDLELGELSWAEIQDALARTWRVVDLTGESSGAPLPAELDQAVTAIFPALDGESRRLAAKGLRAFPNFLALLPRFAIPRKLVATRHPEQPADGHPAWTEIDFTFELNRPYLEARWPRVATFFAKMEDLFESRFRLEDASGRELLRIEMETSRFTVRLRAAVSGGRLVPLGPDGARVFDGAVNPFMESGRPRWTGDLVLRVAGITLRIEGVRFDAEYETHQGLTSFRTTFDTPPEVKVEGALWGVVPIWVVDLLIPGNLEELGGKYFRTLAAANGGRGSIAQFIFAPGATSSRMSIRTQAALEDSGFAGFMMRLFGSRMRPDPEAKREWRQIATAALDAFGADYALLRGYYRVDG